MIGFLKTVTCISAIVAGTTTALATPTVYISLGSGNQVVAVDAATNRVIKRYSGIDNPHGLALFLFFLAYGFFAIALFSVWCFFAALLSSIIYGHFRFVRTALARRHGAAI